MNSKSTIEKVKHQFVEKVRRLQEEISGEMHRIDPELIMTEDLWQRQDFNGHDGGGGRTRAFRGSIFENAGVNTSLVFGAMDPKFARSLGVDKGELWASGISLIIHPFNPKVPTTHANFRMIQAQDKIWFGGGADLTPYFPFPEDFKTYHDHWKGVLGEYYQQMKETCDRYFTNTHRGQEMRGIGGFFYDHFTSGDWEKDFEMIGGWMDQFIPSYFPLVEKRMDEPFSAVDEEFMLYRRGRYVEFNLLHDRGTKFGLESGGRTESILIYSTARFRFGYGYKPPENSSQAEMMKYYFSGNVEI